MTFEQRLYSGIIVGITLWLTTKVISFLVTRNTIGAGILTDIELRIKSIKESDQYLNKWFSSKKVGDKIEYTLRWEAIEYTLFNSLLPEMPKYYSKNSLSILLRYYNSLIEYDALYKGFFMDISSWKDEERVLSEEDLKYLSKKKERILKLGEILSNADLKSISTLPVDYEGKIAPTSIID